MHQDSILKVLRETSAYANMMIRNYLPEKVNIRFKPIEIFREIKLLVENKDEKIKKLESEIKMNKEKYRSVGIDMGKIFIINTKGDLMQLNNSEIISYGKLNEKVNEIFPNIRNK